MQARSAARADRNERVGQDSRASRERLAPGRSILMSSACVCISDRSDGTDIERLEDERELVAPRDTFGGWCALRLGPERALAELDGPA